MTFIRELPGTGLEVSAIGLGTVKFGRNQGVKYPAGFTLPDDMEVRNLLSVARELDIRLLDTAPAYGSSEERLGQLLENRQDWVIATKVGEEFEDGNSRFDFSAKHTRRSIERSLQRLNTDYLDLVLIHSDGNDEAILKHSDCLEALRQCQQAGKVRAIGMSTKTIEGGLLAAREMDVVMVTYNLQQQDKAVVEYAHQHNKGILVKKALMSGHLQGGERDPVQASLACIFAEPGVNSVILGTINPVHMLHNVNTAKRVLGNLAAD